MTQQRPAPTPIDWSQTPATWIALALSFLAVSTPQWVAALGQGSSLAYVAASGLTAAAVLFVAQARTLDRARRG